MKIIETKSYSKTKTAQFELSDDINPDNEESNNQGQEYPDIPIGSVWTEKGPEPGGSKLGKTPFQKVHVVNYRPESDFVVINGIGQPGKYKSQLSVDEFLEHFDMKSETGGYEGSGD